MFQWDLRKAANNALKHGVSFDEAASVFEDEALITFLDRDHSLDEDRFITLGFSQQGRLLLVAHTERGDDTRVISARPATPREERIYVRIDR